MLSRWAPVVLLCQGIFSLLTSNSSFTHMNPDFVQRGRTHSHFQTTSHQLWILTVDETPDWKTLPLFVWLWVANPLIFHCKRSDFPSRGAPRCFCCSLVDVAGSRLPGQASDFSHGSQTLGQTAAVLSPVTSFHADSNEGQESLRNSVSRGPTVKLYTEHVQMLD